MTEKHRLDLTLLLPDMDAGDGCVELLTRQLLNTRGVSEAHIVRENGVAKLCLHYDPDLVPLAKIERIAHQVGAEVTARYRHEAIPLESIPAADAALTLSQVLEALPGMLHAHVNYAAGVAFVAYDSEQLSREEIEDAIRSLGYRPSPEAAHLGLEEETEKEHDHDHGSAPAFLPHWMQERWTLILVGLAGMFFLIGWLGETFFGLSPDIALLFFILSYIAGGYDIATHAIPALFRGKFDTDVLMLAAAAGAAILGEWAEGAFLLFLFSLGHAGEHYALDRARDAVNALGKLMPKTARVKRGNQIIEVPVQQVRIGDIVVVRAGDRIPVDGAVVQGASSVDQSPITGESVPVPKQDGDDVFAGTINLEGALDVRVTKLAKDNTLSRVMQMVAEAQSQQSPTQQFTERFSTRFVPAILLLVLAVIVIPPLVGWMSWADSFYRGMLLLVAASPCALAIGTPAAVLAGVAQAARSGVLIKGGAHLENLGMVKVMAFDKTGTLTQGRFQVTDIIPLDGTDPDELLRLAAAVEKQSNHPLAQAVVAKAEEKRLDLPLAANVKNLAGRGLRSQIQDKALLVGSPALIQEENGRVWNKKLDAILEELEIQGKTTIWVQYDGRVLGALALADTPRPGVRGVMERLRALGIQRLVMLTGDHEQAAQKIAREVGVTDVRAELLPEDKLKAIKEMEAQHGSVAMVGDGVNDAPALATATVGIAMGAAGTAVALETADVALMADDLSKLPFAVGLSRASRRIIVQNLGVSLGVIGLLILTSVAGLMALSGAVVLHEGSTIIVVLNALRLLRYDYS
ncbi:MAG: cadmium-translocating P-type ATPase [Chloroflexi bacterium]|nr:cadmium-translocating P-type ATPase [Chloroflexota bacterium]